MSLRPQPRDARDAARSPFLQPIANLPRAADVGCYGSARIGGHYPCGVIVSYGKHLDEAYIVTTKELYQLGSEAGARLERVLPEGMSKRMMAVQQAMNDMGGPMYRNMYRYKIAQHGTPFDAATEIASFGAQSLSVYDGGLGEAFKPTMEMLQKYYTDGYTVDGFRISSYY